MITAPVKELAFGDICGQGLAFYGGNLVYRMEIARPYFFRAVTGIAVIAITQRQEICAQAVWPVCRSVLWGHFKMKMARCISFQSAV